jgi:hypothetical protein
VQGALVECKQAYIAIQTTPDRFKSTRVVLHACSAVDTRLYVNTPGLCVADSGGEGDCPEWLPVLLNGANAACCWHSVTMI